MFNSEAVNHVSKLELREIERSFARLFSSEEGKRCLAYLQLTSFHRALPANATDEELRYAEGQRALLANITRLIERGRHA